ncbi:MAG: DsrE family protein [Gemmataceae bacterium]
MMSITMRVIVVLVCLASLPMLGAQDKAAPKFAYPIIQGYGGVVPVPDAVEPPVKGSKVVFDVTAIAKEPGKPVPGLERVAVLLNLAGLNGLKANDLEIVVVMHGEVTYSALTNEAYQSNRKQPHASSELIDRLAAAGVKFVVCGQSMAKKGLDAKDVRKEVRVAQSALTATINAQAKGFAYIPAH